VATHRSRPIALLMLAALAIPACAGDKHDPPPATLKQPSQWPSAGDYTTIRIADAVLKQALFHETDYRRRSFAASLAMHTLLTVRLQPGPCATYTSHLSDELRSLLDAAPAENWAPLKAVVRQDPPLRAICKRPPANEPDAGEARTQRPEAAPRRHPPGNMSSSELEQGNHVGRRDERVRHDTAVVQRHGSNRLAIRRGEEHVAVELGCLVQRCESA
jgi:hypothetical protein